MSGEMETEVFYMSTKNKLFNLFYRFSFMSICSFGIRFPCMSDAYSKDLRRLALEVGSELGCSDFIREGVYCMVSGPNFETIAEARMLLILGCDSVGKTERQTLFSGQWREILPLTWVIVHNGKKKSLVQRFL